LDSAHENADFPMVREHLQDWDNDQPDINRSRRGRNV